MTITEAMLAAGDAPSVTAAKLNLGCGSKRFPGFLNVDRFPGCNPDLVLDLEKFPWPWPTDSVTDVVLNHVLEHIGHDPAVFLNFMKELYRVCRHAAEVKIAVPHPRHDTFIDDPTHVRPITPGTLALFSKSANQHFIKVDAPNSPLALYTDTDFEIIDVAWALDAKWNEKLESGDLKKDEILELVRTQNNICKEYQITLRVLKAA
jgi:SAM-dependent methyltransferase